jgi:hypothetical protein
MLMNYCIVDPLDYSNYASYLRHTTERFRKR